MSGHGGAVRKRRSQCINYIVLRMSQKIPYGIRRLEDLYSKHPPIPVQNI